MRPAAGDLIERHVSDVARAVSGRPERGQACEKHRRVRFGAPDGIRALDGGEQGLPTEMPENHSREPGGFVAREGQSVARASQSAERSVDAGQWFGRRLEHFPVTLAKQAHPVLDPVRSDPTADQLFESVSDLRSDGRLIQRFEVVMRPRMIERLGDRPVGIDQRSVEVEDQTMFADGYSRSGATIGRDEGQPRVSACRLRLNRP